MNRFFFLLLFFVVIGFHKVYLLLMFFSLFIFVDLLKVFAFRSCSKLFLIEPFNLQFMAHQLVNPFVHSSVHSLYFLL